jgi:GNAT superfamily N-acetyltransferase
VTPPADYKLRLVYARDYEKELMRLQKACLPNDEPLLPKDGGWWWVITARFGIAVAFASMHLKFDRKGPNGYLTRSGVVEAHRGHGLQKRLIKARAKVAACYNLKSLVTTTFENGPSGNSLIACGFRLFEPDEPWMAPGTNYWRKTLAWPKGTTGQT